MFAATASRLLQRFGRSPTDTEALGRALSALDHGLAIQTYLDGRPTPLDIFGLIANLLPTTESA